jgi:hypothetical protein
MGELTYQKAFRVGYAKLGLKSLALGLRVLS